MTSAARAGYVLITPVRNESASLPGTIGSVLRQTARPERWIILDDGSRDRTAEIADEAARAHSFIRVVRLPDRGHDAVGEGVAALMNRGLALADLLPADYIAKLDADVEIPDRYFATLMAALQDDPTLGIVSGHPYTYQNGRKFLERHGDFFPSGTARLYRRDFLRDIGGFVNSVGWDTVDILKMRMRGRLTRVLHDLEYHHLRRMGTRNGYIDGMVRDGRNAYLTGYSPLFFALRAVWNARDRPYLLRTGCMLWGFAQGYLRRLPRIVTDEERAFHLRMQRRRLLLMPIDCL